VHHDYDIPRPKRFLLSSLLQRHKHTLGGGAGYTGFSIWTLLHYPFLFGLAYSLAFGGFLKLCNWIWVMGVEMEKRRMKHDATFCSFWIFKESCHAMPLAL